MTTIPLGRGAATASEFETTHHQEREPMTTKNLTEEESRHREWQIKMFGRVIPDGAPPTHLRPPPANDGAPLDYRSTPNRARGDERRNLDARGDEDDDTGRLDVELDASSDDVVSLGSVRAGQDPSACSGAISESDRHVLALLGRDEQWLANHLNGQPLSYGARSAREAANRSDRMRARADSVSDSGRAAVSPCRTVLGSGKAGLSQIVTLRRCGKRLKSWSCLSLDHTLLHNVRIVP
jgi:hypothetical protein